MERPTGALPEYPGRDLIRTRRPSKWHVAGSGMVLLLKLLVSAIVLATPVVGVWVASSLGGNRGGAQSVPVRAGLAVFPITPLAWDFWSEWRRKQKPSDGERILTVWDRLLLRTFAVSFVLVAALLWATPEKAFEALSTRGDWMLDAREGDLAIKARRAILGAAHGLEWLYDVEHEDPFAELAPEDANRVTGDEPKPGERPASQGGPSREPGGASTAAKAPEKPGTEEKARETD